MNFKQFPTIRYLDDDTVEKIRAQPLMLKHPYYNQKEKLHIMVETEAEAGHDQRYGLIL